MHSKLFLVLMIGVCAVAGSGQKTAVAEEQAVRGIIEKWNSGYHGLDAKVMAAVVADQFELVDRFGERTVTSSTDEYEKMWTWAFANVYRGIPGPRHTIENVRFVTPQVAVVQAVGKRTEPVILPDGKKIPPFSQHVTFVLVKTREWKITSQNVHNRFTDPSDAHKPGTKPWQKSAVKK